MISRRSFLGLLTAAPVAAIVKPKPSFFFFGEARRPNFSLQELHRAVGRATYGASKPEIVRVTSEQWLSLYKKMGPYPYGYSLGFNNIAFTGIPVTDESIDESFYRIVDVRDSLGRPG